MANSLWDYVQGDDFSDIRVLKALLEKSPPSILQETQDEWTLLHYLVSNASADDVPADIISMVCNESNATIADDIGYTPLHLACKNKSSGLATRVEVLTKQIGNNAAALNAKIPSSSTTPLHLLASNPSVSAATLKVLKADGSVTDENGNTALHLLAENEGIHVNAECFEVLLGRLPSGALNISNNYDSTVFHYVCQNERLVNVSVLSTMFKYNANPNIPDNIGSTPCHYVTASPSRLLSTSLLQLLIDSSANFLARNSFGKLPLDNLIETGAPADCIKLIQKFAPHHREQSSDSQQERNNSGGGEDTSMLEDGSKVKKYLLEWNASLPPIDNEFYVAICCDAAFSAQYEAVQQAAADVLGSETESNNNMLVWKDQMTKWRKCVLVGYLSLMDPSIWPKQQSIFDPALLEKVRNVWNSHPTAASKRLEAIQLLLK